MEKDNQDCFYCNHRDVCQNLNELRVIMGRQELTGKGHAKVVTQAMAGVCRAYQAGRGNKSKGGMNNTGGGVFGMSSRGNTWER